jgi:hypothetical protein
MRRSADTHLTWIGHILRDVLAGWLPERGERILMTTTDPAALAYDEQTAAQMLALLSRLDPAQRLDTLAVVAKVLIQPRLRGMWLGSTPLEEQP